MVTYFPSKICPSLVKLVPGLILLGNKLTWTNIPRKLPLLLQKTFSMEYLLQIFFYFVLIDDIYEIICISNIFIMKILLSQLNSWTYFPRKRCPRIFMLILFSLVMIFMISNVSDKSVLLNFFWEICSRLQLFFGGD